MTSWASSLWSGFSDRWSEIFQSLSRNQLRSFLTACGVFWGVFMLVVMLGFGNGLQTAIVSTMGGWARNAIFLWTERTAKPFAGRLPGRRVQLVEDDAAAIAAKVPGVALVLPRNHVGGYGGSATVARKGVEGTFGVSGEESDYQRLEHLTITGGRFLNPLDDRELRKVAIIGARVADRLFPQRENPLGQELRIGNSTFLVVGVFRAPSTGGDADRQNGRVFVPRATFKRTFATGNHVDYFAILVAPGFVSGAVQAQVMTLLKARHRVAPDDPRALAGFNLEKEYRKLSNLFFGIGVLTWIVGVATVLAGAVGVGNIMTIAVAERTKEIGIRKALGATPVSILLQIVLEAVVLTAGAGYLGFVAGVGLLEGVGFLLDRMPSGQGPTFFAHPQLDFGRGLVAVAALTLAGLLAGLAPARNALAIRPVEALAYE